MKPAVAIKPKTPVDVVFPYADKLHMVLVMTVEPGFGGQSFMPDMMPKVCAPGCLSLCLCVSASAAAAAAGDS